MSDLPETVPSPTPTWDTLVDEAELCIAAAQVEVHRQLAAAFRGDASTCDATRTMARTYTEQAVKLLRDALRDDD